MNAATEPSLRMRSERRRTLRTLTARACLGLCALVVLPAAKCFDYDAELDRSDPNIGPIGGGDTRTCEVPEIPPPSAAGCLSATCLGQHCYADRAVAYWELAWEAHAVRRELHFAEDGGALAFEVRDGNGSLSDLVFPACQPVTLTVVAEAGLAATHDLTGPLASLAVAWWEIRTVDGAYRAPRFDAVRFEGPSPEERRAELRFVPLVPGAYTLYSSIGVTNGDDYSGIAEGTVAPDLESGDAGAGMQTTLTIETSRTLRLFQGYDPERARSLDADPRRQASDAVWDAANLATLEVQATEGIDPLSGADVFTFVWSTRSLTLDRGHELVVRSAADNLFQHNVSAPLLLKDSVVRAATDTQIELRAPYFDSTNIEPGGEIHVWFVPTRARVYQAYCRLGLNYALNGAPDFATGHPGAGMLDEVTVLP